MDTSTWRVRVLLEPRGFIRAIEVLLAIVAFATTGGFRSTGQYNIKCNNTLSTNFTVTVNYPFKMSSKSIEFTYCNGTKGSFMMEGDLAASAQWFMFVAVTAFLIALAALVFYVVFDAAVRQSHEDMVTKGDLIVTVLYSFFWLTAASAWAWGLGQVKMWSDFKEIQANAGIHAACSAGGETVCTVLQHFDYSPLNASVAFAFLNCFLWVCNVWFVYKETPWHVEPDKQPDVNQPPPQNFQ